MTEDHWLHGFNYNVEEWDERDDSPPAVEEYAQFGAGAVGYRIEADSRGPLSDSV